MNHQDHRERIRFDFNPTADNLDYIDLIPREGGGLESLIGPYGIWQDHVTATSWALRVEEGPLEVARALLACYRLKVVYMQRYMLLDVKASGVFPQLSRSPWIFDPVMLGQPWVFERGTPLTVRLVLEDQKALLKLRAQLATETAPVIALTFEMSGRITQFARPDLEAKRSVPAGAQQLSKWLEPKSMGTCAMCGRDATWSGGTEARCEENIGIRITSITRQVSEFHRAFDSPILDKPQVPADDRVRLRLTLIAEELFELMTSSLNTTEEELLDGGTRRSPISELEERMMGLIKRLPVRVDIVEFADALADLDYVIEGSRLEFGINGAPVAAEVHRANMTKVGGHRRTDGKWVKPASFTPPDIEAELRKQGWKGNR